MKKFKDKAIIGAIALSTLSPLAAHAQYDVTWQLHSIGSPSPTSKQQHYTLIAKAICSTVAHTTERPQGDFTIPNPNYRQTIQASSPVEARRIANSIVSYIANLPLGTNLLVGPGVVSSILICPLPIYSGIAADEVFGPIEDTLPPTPGR